METSGAILLAVLAVAALISPMVYAAMNWIKWLTNRMFSQALTQLGAWGVAIAFVFIVAATDFGNTPVPINGENLTLDTLRGWTLFVIGFNVGSIAILGYDWFKSRGVDTPKLIPSANKNQE